MKIPGIGAYVLVSNRLDIHHEGEAAFEANAREIFEKFPEVDFGIYECPQPWKRLVSIGVSAQGGAGGAAGVFEDTCCDYELVRERQQAVEGNSPEDLSTPMPSPGLTVCSTALPATAASWPTTTLSFTSGALIIRTAIRRRPAWWRISLPLLP